MKILHSLHILSKAIVFEDILTKLVMEVKLLLFLWSYLFCLTYGQVNKTAVTDLNISKPTIFVRPFSGWKQCCTKGEMWINLQGLGFTWGYVPGVTRPSFGSPYPKRKCGIPATFKTTFQNLRHGCSGCVYEPECGRRMLQVDLFLGTQTGGWVFNVGDSATNNGYGGDASTQENDAELQGLNSNANLYGSDKCKGYTQTFTNFIGSGVNHVRLYISNEFIRIQNNKGYDRRVCKSCLYALNYQSDSQGSRNFDVYFGLNRVVQTLARRGYGVCRARVKWACPCSEN